MLGLVQRNGKLTAVVAKDTPPESIHPVIRKYVQPETVFISDDWKDYKNLGDNYLHYTVKHTDRSYKREYDSQMRKVPDSEKFNHLLRNSKVRTKCQALVA